MTGESWFEYSVLGPSEVRFGGVPGALRRHLHEFADRRERDMKIVPP
jgi:hypothetical protein